MSDEQKPIEDPEERAHIQAERDRFAQRLASEGIDVEDYAREEKRRREELQTEGAPREDTVLETSRAMETQIIETLHSQQRGAELQEKLGIDELTGAASLRKYKAEAERLQREARGNRQRRSDIPEILLREPFSIIALDIDYFKRINDTYGHGAGDQVLRELSRRIRNRLRNGDVFARVGGEEFRIIALASNGSAPVLAETLRKLIVETPFSITDNEGQEHLIEVTISLGVSPYREETDRMENISDAALYRAKERRNEVRLWNRELNAFLPYGETKRQVGRQGVHKPPGASAPPPSAN